MDGAAASCDSVMRAFNGWAVLDPRILGAWTQTGVSQSLPLPSGLVGVQQDHNRGETWTSHITDLTDAFFITGDTFEHGQQEGYEVNDVTPFKRFQLDDFRKMVENLLANLGCK